MAVRGILQGLTKSYSDASASHGDAKLRHDILDDFELAGIGWIWATNADGNLIYISAGAVERFGSPLDSMLGQPFISLFETDGDNPDERSDRPLNFQLKARNKIRDLTVRFAHNKSRHEARQIWLAISGQPKFDSRGNFEGYRGSANDISVDYERKLVDSRLAEYDSLTDLANRHYMNRRLDSIIGAFKSAKRSCALMMLDLDKFKRINDTMGHPAGDALLVQVAERLRNIIGDRGEIGRLGGDEFQIILPDLDDRGKLGEIADKVIQILSQPYPIDEKRAIIGASVGIAIAPYDGIEREELVRSSDLALYAAKNGGRGQFRFYSDDLKNDEEERELLLDDLRIALEAHELNLFYQPVVEVSDNTIVCLEALMRWDHDVRGPVSPGVFIPIAEETDLINKLGEWALNHACMDAMQWPSTVRVAVNVSAVQFTDPGFADVVANALASSGLEPERLELELTESIFVGDSEVTEQIFTDLKKIGVRLALDDFGTGFSSLSYLRSAPFDKIKVDRTFVDSCTQEDKNSAKIIAAIVGLSNALGMETTVEGVEAFDQLEVVSDKGARLIQGFLYSRAIPQAEVLRLVETGEFKIKPEGPKTFRPERRSVFRRVGFIHDDHRYDVVMRDLSKNGALVEGVLGVPVGTQLVLDLGAGQLVVGSVNRVQDAEMGIEFETSLVSDGAGGLCTRNRISPYALAVAGMPLTALQPGSSPHMQMNDGPKTKPQFLQANIGFAGAAA